MRGLNWCDERYVRLYTRDTPDWSMLSWLARGLYSLLRREADRAGVVQLGRAGRRGVAAVVQARGEEIDDVLDVLDELVRDGWVELGATFLVLPEFIESEEARATDVARQRAHRERVRDKARADALASGAPPSVAEAAARQASVTSTVTPGGHAETSHRAVTPRRNTGRSRRDVTPGGHAKTSHEDGSPSVPSVPEGSLPPVVVPAPAPFARVREGDDDKGGGRKREGGAVAPDGTVTGRPTDEAPAGASPAPEAATPPPSAPAVPRRARPRFEPQRTDDGRELVDPVTGRPLVLDLANLSSTEVAEARARAIAAMPPGAPPRVPPTDPSPPGAPPPPGPLPLPFGEIPDGDVEGAVRGILAAAPLPIRLLADHPNSAARLATGLVGGQHRIADVRAGILSAGMKLDPRFAGLVEGAPPAQLEDLHRFVAGFVADAPRRRHAVPAAVHTPPPAASAAGEKLFAHFKAQYEVRFGRAYTAAEDDVLHATEITTELGKRLDAERVRVPELDIGKARKRLVAALFESWFGDSFGARSGHSLRHLARLLRDEPNRFHLDESRPHGQGAAGMRIDPEPPPRRELSGVDADEVQRAVDDLTRAPS